MRLGDEIIETIIQKENIRILQRVAGWREAIIEASAPLIEGGYIESRYVQAIFDSTEKHGPYYVLAPEIAMPHAGAKDGVLKQQISLLVLKEPVYFSEGGFGVRLVFVLAAIDNQSHLGMLRQLADVFANEELIQDLIDAHDPDVIANLLNNLKKERG